MLMLIVAIVVALVLFSILRKLVGPVILLLAVMFGWQWLVDNTHWGSGPQAPTHQAGDVWVSTPKP